MKLKEVYEHLCSYDKRSEFYDKEDNKEARKNCYCDNCFYERDKLALQSLKQNEALIYAKECLQDMLEEIDGEASSIGRWKIIDEALLK